MSKEDYKVGESYKYSQLPDENTDDLMISDYGLEYLGQNAIHVRYHKTETDLWFIYEAQLNEGIFKCVYNN